MRNPYRAPRPTPIDPEDLFPESRWEDLVSHGALRRLIEENFEWLCHTVRHTEEIYRALFHLVDRDASHQCEVMRCLNEALWEMGFRTAGEDPRKQDPSWHWSEVV